jgi:hypothetical protein
MTIKQQKVIYSSSPEGLNTKISEHINDGWQPVGSHTIAEEHHQNRFRGTQHVDTIIKSEYAQTMVIFAEQ